MSEQQEEVVHGLFGPGIFASGIDLSALDEDTAWKLGQFFGEQILAAEKRGYDRATDIARRRHESLNENGAHGEAWGAFMVLRDLEPGDDEEGT